MGNSLISKKRKLYIPTNDFKSAFDVKKNLPQNLQIYCNSIEVLYRFWCSEIETLNESDFKEAAVLFYVNVFKLIPDARKLFTKNIEFQAKQFFAMFRWLITNLKNSNSKTLIKKIKILGKIHKKMNIKEEWYKLFLNAFHKTMIETVNEKYTVRIRFCMEQLYTIVMNIMLNKDFQSLPSEKISCLLKSLGKLQDCLEGKEGRLYLQMYMKQQFCVELMLFYQEYRKFKGCMADYQRQKIGENILKTYIDVTAQCEINVSYGAKNNLFMTLKTNDNIFIPSIFDECVKETVELIRNNIWSEFKKSILKMTVAANINYDTDTDELSMDTRLSISPLPFESYPSNSFPSKSTK